MSPTTTTETHSGKTSSANKLTGCVKWFNNKAGYGFITALDGSTSGSDIFAHHTSIGGATQYKYLVQGEYVEFLCSPTQKGTHDVQAVSISGIKGGNLMYETLNDMKVSKNSHASGSTKTVEQESPQPKSEDSDKKGWTLVNNHQSVEDTSDNKVEKKPKTPRAPKTSGGRGEGASSGGRGTTGGRGATGGRGRGRGAGKV